VKLIPYARQSRSDEVTIELDRQVAEMREWAERNGAELTEPVIERSVSGNKPWRERELGAVVERIHAGEADGIIVGYASRMTREKLSATFEVLEELEAYTRVYVDKNRVQRPGESDLLRDAIDGAISHNEWRTLAGHLRNGKHESWEAGKFVGVPPAGYISRLIEKYNRRGVQQHGQVEKGEHAPTVARALKLRADGGSWSEVARLLMDAGVPTTRGNAHWSTQAVSTIARNPIYRGLWRCSCGCGEETLRTELAIVSPKVWDDIQARFETDGAHTPGRKDRGRAMLAGLLRCAECNGTLSYDQSRDRWIYYRCRNGYKSHPTISAPVVEAHVAGIMHDLFEGFERPNGDTPDTAALDAAIERARADLEAWDDAFDADSDPVAFRRGREKRKAALTAAENARAEAVVTVTPEEEALYAALEREDLRAIRDYWRSLPVAEQRRFIGKQFPEGFIVVKGNSDVQERVFTPTQFRRRFNRGKP
jgi:DNA invertase Pin-like site-specific DNA recombinase